MPSTLPASWQGQRGVATRRTTSRAEAAASAFFIQQLSCVKLQKCTRLMKSRIQKTRDDSWSSSMARQLKLDSAAITGSVISSAPHACHEYQREHQLCSSKLPTSVHHDK